jgi:DNA-binding NarL/FixJ family response regulator
MPDAANTKTRVLIVDDNELIRLMLKMQLEHYSDIEVVGIVADGATAIAAARQYQLDVILMDLSMPSVDGLTASRIIKQENSKIYTIAYTSFRDPQVEVMAQAAAIDYLCYKDTEVDVLVDLIRQSRQRQTTGER